MERYNNCVDLGFDFKTFSKILGHSSTEAADLFDDNNLDICDFVLMIM